MRGGEGRGGEGREGRRGEGSDRGGEWDSILKVTYTIMRTQLFKHCRFYLLSTLHTNGPLYISLYGDYIYYYTY